MIKSDMLVGKYWKIDHNNNGLMTENLRFLDDGTIGLYSRPYQRRWLIELGVLLLLDLDGNITSKFDTFSSEGGSTKMLALLSPSPERRGNLTEMAISWTQFPGSTKNKMADQISRYGWSVGDHTYGLPFVGEARGASLYIGKENWIAAGVIIMLGNHRIDTVSLYPFRHLNNYWPSCPSDA